MLSTLCMVEYMFQPMTALSNRWTRSISFNWSHSGGCSGICNAYSILLFQVTISDTYLFIYTGLPTLLPEDLQTLSGKEALTETPFTLLIEAVPSEWFWSKNFRVRKSYILLFKFENSMIDCKSQWLCNFSSSFHSSSIELVLITC